MSILGCIVGAIEAGPEDRLVGTLIEAVAANGIDKHVGRCAGAAPKVGEIARWVCGRLRGASVRIGGHYIGSSDGTIGKAKIVESATTFRKEGPDLRRMLDHSLSSNYVRRIAARYMVRVTPSDQCVCRISRGGEWTCKN